jgi:predicted  nucleic acid-binding Zn-ribbon protein
VLHQLTSLLFGGIQKESGALATTDYHSQYLAYELTKRCASDSVEKLAGAVAGAQVDLNPHQVDAGFTRQRQSEIQRTISERNARFFEAEAEKLEGWGDDLKLGLEREIKEIDRQIKEARRSATAALSLEEKLAGQKQIKALESHRNDKRRSLFAAQDRVDQKRESLIATIEGKLAQSNSITTLFVLRWELH